MIPDDNRAAQALRPHVDITLQIAQTRNDHCSLAQKPIAKLGDGDTLGTPNEHFIVEQRFKFREGPAHDRLCDVHRIGSAHDGAEFRNRERDAQMSKLESTVKQCVWRHVHLPVKNHWYAFIIRNECASREFCGLCSEVEEPFSVVRANVGCLLCSEECRTVDDRADGAFTERIRVVAAHHDT